MFFYFFLSFTFTSDGLIVMTVAASISGDIVYSISNLKWMDGWMDGWIDGFLLIAWRLSLAQTSLQAEEFLLHAPHLAKWFMWGVSLTHSCCLMWGVSLKHPLLFYVVRLFYMHHAFLLLLFGGVFFFFYMAHAVLYGELLLHTPSGSLFSMPCSISYQEFILHTLCKFMCGDFLIVCPVFFRVKSFFYVPQTPDASFNEEFLLHS